MVIPLSYGNNDDVMGIWLKKIEEEQEIYEKIYNGLSLNEFKLI